MNRIVSVMLATLSVCAGCSKPGVITPREFTAQYAEAIQKVNADLKVVVVQDLQVKVTSPNGMEISALLDNAYDTYRQDPAARTEVIEKYVTASLEVLQDDRDNVDLSRVVPVVKDRPWLAETREGLLSRGVTEIPELVIEDFTPDLVVLYAEDSPENIRYLTRDALKETKIDAAKLRRLACDNLQRLLPEIELDGADGFYVVRAGGSYEASLVLLDSIWNEKRMPVKGEYVVAIPTRGLLIVTGSDDLLGIAKVQNLVDAAWNEGAYRLTRKLFLLRDGALEEFKSIVDRGRASEAAAQ
jgi:uncharacterized protein YtpQ (UPF0354 family)